MKSGHTIKIKGKIGGPMAKDKEPFYKGVNQKQFLNKDGLLKGGVEIKIPEEIPTKNKVGGQRRMLKDKKSEVSWW